MAATHLLVGAGKMGGALLKGWLEAGLVAPKKLAILDPAPGPQAIYAMLRRSVRWSHRNSGNAEHARFNWRRY